ncbi:MAG: magnesium/cobalt transporter CorA [Deltaproteobacteria bacterium]|nr:magnesium/cobalt transporter CorA [Deltaproteobacteria bacterium]
MPAPYRKRSGKIGLPPGSLIHIGKRLSDKTTITILDYNESRHEEREAANVSDCGVARDGQTVRWINVDAVHDIRILEELGPLFGLHPLTLEDILNTDQRPKMEDFGNYLYIVLKMFVPTGGRPEEPSSEQISIVLGKDFVISFQERKSDVFNPLRERIRSNKGRMARMGADYLAYAILDTVVDNYFAILENKEENMDALEEALIKTPTPAAMHAIQSLKREMIYLRKAVWPLRETINNLERSESPLIGHAIRPYLKDVYDHTIQVIDTVETFRDMLSGMLDIYMSSISNKMNEIMKVLTIIATIFIPLTFIVGLYGMNFKYMPELELRWGYFAVWLVMIAVVIFMLFYFKRKKWL